MLYSICIIVASAHLSHLSFPGVSPVSDISPPPPTSSSNLLNKKKLHIIKHIFLFQARNLKAKDINGKSGDLLIEILDIYNIC